MKIEPFNEIDLVQQTLNGDTSAFDRLVKKHRTTIYALVLSYIKNPVDAEDLTQRIFIRAYERLATLRELNRFLPWLQQIAHNTCKDWLRRRNDSTTCFEATNDTNFAEVAPSPEEIALKAEIETVVQQAISTLRKTDRRLMEARYIEGANYDQLQVESGLSYAAVANRLKRAKQEVRQRIEKLLGGVVILPGQTFILGGIEAVKLSVKAKLAAVGVAAIIGIGGGGVLYHHAFESNPVRANEQAISAANAVTEDPSTEVVSLTNAMSSNNSLTNGAADEAKDLEIPTNGVMKTTTVDVKNMVASSEKLKALELSEEAWAVLEEFVHTHAGDVRAALEIELASNGKVLSAVKIDTQEELTEEIRQAIEERKNKDANPLVLKIKGDADLADLPENLLLVPEGLKQQIQSGEVEVSFQPTVSQTPSTPTESQPNSAHSVLTPSDPSVESATTRPEVISEVPTQFSSDDEWAAFEELLSEFSDDEWAELERLLRTASERETLQRDEQAPLNVQPQRQVEEAIEGPPVDPTMRQEMQYQRHPPLERNIEVSPPKADRNMGR